MTRLSAILITRNEERDLPACLASLRGVADEIVLVDSGSTDRTRDIARAAGARVFERAWEGFGPQKQFALEQATGDWVLNLDADEGLSPLLQEEIRGVLSQPTGLSGYELPFHLYFLGRRLRFGGCAREFHVRLFRRAKARYVGGKIHEGITVDGPLGRLRGPVRHESYKTFGEYLEKCNRYTDLIAEKKYAEGKRFAVWHHLRLPWEWIVRVVFKAGCLDGNAGIIYATLSAYYAWLKHVRLIEKAAAFAASTEIQEGSGVL
jgi:glycosyltransferase involved in cell wall biosynthesis